MVKFKLDKFNDNRMSTCICDDKTIALSHLLALLPDMKMLNQYNVRRSHLTFFLETSLYQVFVMCTT